MKVPWMTHMPSLAHSGHRGCSSWQPAATFTWLTGNVPSLIHLWAPSHSSSCRTSAWSPTCPRSGRAGSWRRWRCWSPCPAHTPRSSSTCGTAATCPSLCGPDPCCPGTVVTGWPPRPGSLSRENWTLLPDPDFLIKLLMLITFNANHILWMDVHILCLDFWGNRFWGGFSARQTRRWVSGSPGPGGCQARRGRSPGWHTRSADPARAAPL